MSTRLRTFLVVLISAGALTACARGAGLQSGSAQPSAGAIQLQVSNGYSLALNLYTFADGISTRVGSVSPGMNTTIWLNHSLLRYGLVQVFARPVGGGPAVASPPLSLRAGETINFQIAPSLINTVTVLK